MTFLSLECKLYESRGLVVFTALSAVLRMMTDHLYWTPYRLVGGGRGKAGRQGRAGHRRRKEMRQKAFIEHPLCTPS